MKRMRFIGIVLVGALFLPASCGKSEGRRPSASAEIISHRVPTEAPSVAPGGAGLSTDISAAKVLPFKTTTYEPQGEAVKVASPGATPPASHAKYLDEASAMVDPPSELPPGGKAMVVGSRVARFFPLVSLSVQDDLSTLTGGTELPIGTLIAVGEALKATDGVYDDLFKFEGEYNYFYPATWEGKKGLVFGADLYGLRGQDRREALPVIGLRYRTGGRYDRFWALDGLKTLDSGLAGRLEASRVALDPSKWREKTDDMYGLYATRGYLQAAFISTDLAAHTLHLLFDKYLQRIEEEYFLSRLMALTAGFLEKLEALAAADDGSVPQYTELLELAKGYFQVPLAILEAAPARVEVGEGEPSFYREMDAQAVYAPYPEKVRSALALIDAHQGWDANPITLYDEDFSQYKPRGHYTRNGLLAAYFKAMMWYGRIHAYMAHRGKQDWVWANEDASRPRTSTDLSSKLTPLAVLASGLVERDPVLLRAWRDLYDPITYLVGKADDLSFDDLLPFMKRHPVKDLKSWVVDGKAIEDFITKAGQELDPPLIAGNSVIYVPSGKDNAPPMGWRLFGQRFTWDSAVHMASSSPRLTNDEPVRFWVSGLDLMRAFGSTAAERLLADWDNGYVRFPMLKPVLEGMDAEFSGRGMDFWASTYYNRTLFLIKSQAMFERGAGFYFTESPLWDTKALLSAHGTWAELRHDTILYVKQVYGGEAECAGFGNWEPTWRIEPVPEPIHYIEPNLAFWTGAHALVRDLGMKTSEMGLLPEAYAWSWESLERQLAKAIKIVELEVEDKPISADQNGFIAAMPSALAQCADPEISRRWGGPDEEDSRMAVIADVYTCVEKKAVLEIGVGTPYRLTVLLNDGQGGKRVATGYCFSYYEFGGPMSDRMTDEEWKEIVYGRGVQQEHLPFWMKEDHAP